jgi:hypothetical protein
MSLDLIGLEIVVKAGSSPDASQSMKNDSEYAKKIIPIRKHGNLLLCTLLLGNVFVNSLNAIYLGKMFSGAVGAVLATALITIFGEIVPQALFQRHALYHPPTPTPTQSYPTTFKAIPLHARAHAPLLSYLGSRPIVIVIVKVFIFVTYASLCRCRRRRRPPHASANSYLGAFPVAFVLERAMGKEIGTIYNKQELRSLIEVYGIFTRRVFLFPAAKPTLSSPHSRYPPPLHYFAVSIISSPPPPPPHPPPIAATANKTKARKTKPVSARMTARSSQAPYPSATKQLPTFKLKSKTYSCCILTRGLRLTRSPAFISRGVPACQCMRVTLPRLLKSVQRHFAFPAICCSIPTCTPKRLFFCRF